MEYVQKQIQAPIGTHLPEDEDVSKLLKDMKSIFEKASKRCENDHNFEELFRYFDLFLENEQERSFLMDRFADCVRNYGRAWFDGEYKNDVSEE